MMTQGKKELIELLLQGWYLKKWKSHTGRDCYRLYDPSDLPTRNCSEKFIKSLNNLESLPTKKKLFKIEAKTYKMTLNLSVVRSLHGKSIIKKLYKQTKLVLQ